MGQTRFVIISFRRFGSERARGIWAQQGLNSNAAVSFVVESSTRAMEGWPVIPMEPRASASSFAVCILCLYLFGRVHNGMVNRVKKVGMVARMTWVKTPRVDRLFFCYIWAGLNMASWIWMCSQCTVIEKVVGLVRTRFYSEQARPV